MSILATRGERAVLILRRDGTQPKFDLADVAREIARGHANGAQPRVLFDWEGVTGWPFEAPAAPAIRYWYSLAPRISRAALIHDERLHRQASMLTAMMRAVGAEVKAFPPGYQERAVVWLEAPRMVAPGPKSARRYPADD